MVDFLRWVIANITATIVGIMIGLPIAYSGLDFVARWLQFEDCSGMPCDDRAFPAIILMGIIGGLVGGIFGYLAFQKFTRREIVAKYLIRYAILGAFLWPMVGVFSIVVFAFTINFEYMVRLISLLDSILPSNPSLRRVYGYICLFIIFVLIPGIALGTILSLLRRIPIYNIKRFLQRNS